MEIDSYGNAKIIPVKAGKAEISATVDGVSETCVVNVTESIKSITTDMQEVELKETQEEEIKVSVDPITTTETIVMISEDEDIAKVYQDQETGAYKILGVAEGNTNIVISSPSNSEISQTIKVNVKALTTPQIKNISITQDEDEKLYDIGEKINIKFVFTDYIKGEEPELKLKFGNYDSVGNVEFIGFEDNNTSLLYQYTVQEGDNGILLIKSLEGGTLTDDTGKLDAILTVSPEYSEEDIEDLVQEDQQLTEETTEDYVSTEAEEISVSKINETNTNYQKSGVIVRAMASETEEDMENSETEEGELVSSGIFRDVSAVITDTTKPTITITANVDKDSCWLKDGDVAKVTITASEELKELPTVTMGGIKANVEGSGTEFVASLPVTDELEEGYLEIKVSEYYDLVGNLGDEVIAKEENIDEPIIIDYSQTKINSIELIKEEGKEYKAGDQFKIRVTFADTTIDRPEYIAATSVPEINIKFGGNEAQGKIESDYVEGEYVDSIIYNYTISDKDSGTISINGFSGNISDVAGNETELSNIEELPKITVTNIESNEDDNNNSDTDSPDKDQPGTDQSGTNQSETGQSGADQSDTEKDSNKNGNSNSTNNKDNGKYWGILPKTGAIALGTIMVCVGIGAVISGISYIIIKIKNS